MTTVAAGTSQPAISPYVSCKLNLAYPNSFFSIDKPIFVKNLKIEFIFNSI